MKSILTSNYYCQDLNNRKMNQLKAVFLSNWFDNPYKQMLTKELEISDIRVDEQIRSVFFLHKVLSTYRPNILHLQTLHYIFASQNWAFYWLKFIIFILQVNILNILGVKTVWTVHEWKDKISGGKHDLSSQKAYILGKALTGIIVHCDSTKHEIINDLSLTKSNKVFVIPHGHYIDCYENSIPQKQAREKLSIPSGSVSFLFFGGIHPGKGVLDAIDAFNNLHYQDIHLTIAGKTSYVSMHAIQEKISNRNNILFSSPQDGISDNDVQIYLNACDIVVLPYRVFTTSGVALLAMSFKRVCIAPNQGFFKDILDEHGSFLYDNRSADGLQQAMVKAIQKQASLPEMGMHNYELAKCFSWDVIAKQTAEVYRWAMDQ